MITQNPFYAYICNLTVKLFDEQRLICTFPFFNCVYDGQQKTGWEEPASYNKYLAFVGKCKWKLIVKIIGDQYSTSLNIILIFTTKKYTKKLFGIQLSQTRKYFDLRLIKHIKPSHTAVLIFRLVSF